MEWIKKNLMVVLAIILAILASFSIFFSIRALSPTASVVVASQNLKVGAVITKDYVSTKNISAKNLPPTAFTSPKDVIGKTIINGPIIAGDVISSEHLSLEGSLMAVLKTFAPKGWTAVELPPGGGAGMKGLKKGDQVDVYGEIGSAQGLIVSEVVKNAVILSTPDPEGNNQQYVIAVPNNYAASIAEAMVRQKPITISLPSDPGNVSAPKSPEIIE